ncbi:hypothetical protein ACH4SP_20870 [Streptomyces sp. NPDC021093]|uniref:hypothetical protein n=1 Tax=Streptomyces sp. NPDC021093 TaxID=3365112 RepID=UPI0037A48032
MSQRALLLVVVVLAAVVVGFMAGIIEFAGSKNVVTAVKYGGGACGAAVLIGLAAVTWLKSS